MVNIYGTLSNNSAATFPAKWYPTIGDREHGVDFNVEVVGTVNRRTEQPVQNLRVSTKGTIVRSSTRLMFEENQEVAFLGYYWIISEVQIDLSSVNPQAAIFGDPLQNAVFELTLIANTPAQGGEQTWT